MPLHADTTESNRNASRLHPLPIAGEGIANPAFATTSSSAISPALSDVEVVQRVLAGDLPSFELIMRRYNQRIFRIARTIIHNDDEAEDIVQETYVRAFEHLHQFEGRAKFSTWLTRIAIREAAARRHRFNRMQLFAEEDSITSRALVNKTPDEDHRSSMRELHDILSDAVHALPEQLRTVFMLRIVEGINTAEVAACLDMSEANVKVTLHRARTLLQNRIDQTLGEEIRRLYQFDGERCDRIVNAVLARIANLP
jgi:RNA polymerase sigma-70 factor (ECF subfamily)